MAKSTINETDADNGTTSANHNNVPSPFSQNNIVTINGFIKDVRKEEKRFGTVDTFVSAKFISSFRYTL